MGASSSVAAALPPLPPGAKLNPTAPAAPSPSGGGLPPLPPGAKLNPASAPASSSPADDLTSNPVEPAAPSQPEEGTLSKILHGAEAMYAGTPTGGAIKSAKATVAGLLNILADHGDEQRQALQKASGIAPGGLTAQITGQNPPDPFTDHMRKAANWLNQNNDPDGFFEHLGSIGENIAELMTPEALGTLAKGAEAIKGGEAAAKVGQVTTAAQKYADAAKVAQTLNKFPRIRDLVALGLSAAAKAGTEVGAQTYVKTGGNTDAALHAGAIAAGAGGVLAPAGEIAANVVRGAAPVTKTIEGVDVPVPQVNAEGNVPAAEAAKVTPAQKAGAEAYTAMARNIVKPHLEAVAAAPDTVDADLNSFHDMTGAAARLTKANDAAYSRLDAATGGRFRALNSEVANAQQAAWSGEPEAQAAYKNKLAEMEDLLSKGTDGKISPADLQKVKASWTQSYVLRDFGKALDQSLDGLPGDSKVSHTQRGINGNVLDKKLTQIVRRYGIDKVRSVLGEGRLENLQSIADATKTNAGRQAVNYAVRRVAGYLGAAGGAAAGGSVAGWEGAAGGAAAGREAGIAAHDAVRRVMFAIRTNPKIGQNLIYAIHAGARPENFGPLIGGMISKVEADAAKQQKQNANGGVQ